MAVLVAMSVAVRAFRSLLRKVCVVGCYLLLSVVVCGVACCLSGYCVVFWCLLSVVVVPFCLFLVFLFFCFWLVFRLLLLVAFCLFISRALPSCAGPNMVIEGSQS